MQKVKQIKNKWFLWSLIVSVLFVIGVAGVPVFAISGNFVIMAVCIALVAFGFYGLPFFWIAFGMRCSILRTCIAIECEHMYTTSDIAQHLNKSENEVQKHITKLVQWRAIDYKFDGNTLTLNKGQRLEEQKWGAKCPSCGANIEGTGLNGQCEYCGWIADKN